MNRFIDFSIASYRLVFMILAFIVIAGSVSYVNIPKESSPDVQVPIIYVSMYLEGVSPEDAERLLIRPMEKKLQSIEGVKEMTSEATLGFASVSLEFDAGFDADAALADVRAEVDKARPELPADVDEPNVMEVNFSQFPVINVVLSGDTDLRSLVTIARNLRDKIEGLSGVLEAKIAGDREEVLDIVLNPATLENYRIQPVEVLQKVANNNVLIAAGQLDTDDGRFGIKLPGLIETGKDLLNTPIISTPEKVVTLRDIAEVKRTFKDEMGRARINGEQAVGISVSKRAGANLLGTIEDIKALVEEERGLFPPSIHVTYSQDTSGEVRSMLSDLENNVMLAILLVLVLVLYYMGVRSALLVAFSIPGAFLIATIFLSLMGMTMNIVVLFSLILSAGLLVDSAIVVCEYADRLMHQGMPPARAYGHAAKRMALPIISSTLTTLAVFMPLLFWPGIVGQFMQYMPITLILTLSGSILMALIFVPTIGSRLAAKGNDSANFNDDEEEERISDNPVTQRYVRIINRSLDMPWRVTLGVLGIVGCIFVLFAIVKPGVEFFPKIEPENANLIVRSAGNLSVEQQDAVMRDVEEILQPLKDEVDIFYTQSGKTTLREAPEDTIGLIQFEFADWTVRRSADEILKDVTQRLATIAGIKVETAQQEQGPPTGKDIQLEFRSRYPELLAPALEQFLSKTSELGGLTNIQDDLPIPRIEWQYEVNRVLAGRNNVSVNDVGQLIKFVTNGAKINEYRPDDSDEEIDINVRFPEEYRSLSQLSSLRVMTQTGALEPISNYVTRTPKQAVSIVKRVDGKRVMNLKADVEEGILPDNKVSQIQKWIDKQDLPEALEVRFRGESEDQAEAQTFLSTAFGIALFAMALILTAQFNSIYRMIVIMSAVFLSTGGVFLGNVLTMQPFGIVMGGVGVIALAGIVVNNNIILIDTYEQECRAGYSVRDALVRACALRLRPILLTAGTTILGLIPMVAAMNIDFLGRDITFGAPSSQWWRQLSTAIAGGLTFATILTLFVTPSMIYLKDRRSKKIFSSF
jgi:multidrug efflux pump